MGWMLKGVRDGTRRFVGSEAIRRELVEGTSRWATTGIVVDWADWDRLHRDAGLLPTKDEQPLAWEALVARRGDEQVGYVTSFFYSPVLQRHVGLARVRPAPRRARHRPSAGDDVAPQHDHGRGQTAPLPFFNPARKTARP